MVLIEACPSRDWITLVFPLSDEHRGVRMVQFMKSQTIEMGGLYDGEPDPTAEVRSTQWRTLRSDEDKPGIVWG